MLRSASLPERTISNVATIGEKINSSVAGSARGGLELGRKVTQPPTVVKSAGALTNHDVGILLPSEVTHPRDMGLGQLHSALLAMSRVAFPMIPLKWSLAPA